MKYLDPKGSIELEAAGKPELTYDEYVEQAMQKYGCSREEAEERLAREEAAANAAETSIFF